MRDAFYRHLLSGILHQSLCNPTHPYPTSFVSQDGLVQHITYLFHMTGRNLFFSRMDDNAICIKFVTCYCRERHEFLAGKGFAPKLHAFERLAGGLYKDWFDIDQKGQVIFIWETFKLFLIHSNPTLLIQISPVPN